MLLSPQSATSVVEQKNNGSAAGALSAVSYSSPPPPSRSQHIQQMYSPTSAVSAPLQDTFQNNPNIMRQTPGSITSSLLSFQSTQTLTTSVSNQFDPNGTAIRKNHHEHSFDIEQPISGGHSQHKMKNSPVKRDRLGTVDSVMAVRSLGSGHRHGQKHSNVAQQMLGSVSAAEGRDAASTSNDNDDASDVSSLSDDGTSSAAAASGGRAVKKSLLKKPRSIRKKTRSRPGSISGRQTSDQAPSIATSITSVTHTMGTIDCSFPSPLTAEINVEKVKSSKDLMGNHRRCHLSMSGATFPLGNRGPMIHDSWTSPTPGFGDALSVQPEKGEDLIDVSNDAPVDPFSGLMGMPSASISMCDNSFASGTTSSLEKPKASSFLRKPAMARGSSVNSEFDPFAKVRSEIPRAPRYLRDNPLLSKSRYRGRLSSPLHHDRAPSLDTACMISSIAMSETNAPVIPPLDCDSLASNLSPLPLQAPSSVTEEPDEDDASDSSYGSFAEELNRKDRGKAFVGDVTRNINNFMERVLPVVGVKPKEAQLKRAEGCLT